MDNIKISDFIFASYSGNTEVVLSLLKKGIDINIRDSSSSTALSEAVLKNHYEVIKILLENNADVNLIYENKYNVLHLAASDTEIDPRIVELLASKISDINQKDKPHKNTALWYACHFGYPNNYKIAEILLKHGADARLVNAYGKTVMDMAEIRSDIPEFKQLLQKYQLK